MPSSFNAYHEPFVGSGALFFDLWSRGRLEQRHVRLSDTNADLIGCYTAIRDNVEEVIASLRALARAHEAAPRTHYYEVRDNLFNPVRRRGAPDGHARYSPELAAMFIYLNRTGFNGLFRLNSLGGFNVPVGRYTKPLICDEQNLRAVAATLSAPNVQLRHSGYESVLREAEAGDLVYFDPPYAPLSATARFTSYTAGGFSEDDQRRLHEIAIRLAERKCHVILSNSTAPLVTALYETSREARKSGLRAHKVPAKRAINSDADRRGDVWEYVISNVATRRSPKGAANQATSGGRLRSSR